MLFQPVDQPHVLVTFEDELLSVCKGQCSYQFKEEPEVTSMVLKETNLEIDVFIPDKIKDEVLLEHYNIRLGDTETLCKIDPSSTIQEIICEVPLNGNGSIRL